MLPPGDAPGHDMIELICDAAVSVAEAFDDEVPPSPFAEEDAVVAAAVAKRRAEFATVRHCARQALAGIGVPPVPLLPGERGAPGWPAGVVGSMTHCQGYRAAAVARASQLVTVGIDAEPDEPLPEGVFDIITVPDDLAALPAGGTVSWDRLLFCAKEAVYKAWFPLARRFLSFEEAHVALDPAGTFTATLLVDGPVVEGAPLRGFTGRWLAADGLLAAAITVPVTRRT